MENKILNAVTIILFVALLVLGYAVIICAPSMCLYTATFWDIVGLATCYHLQISDYTEIQEEED